MCANPVVIHSDWDIGHFLLLGLWRWFGLVGHQIKYLWEDSIWKDHIFVERKYNMKISVPMGVYAL